MTASSPVKINTVSCVDIWRKLNVHKAFRRRPVRSVYVLCLLGPSKNGWLPFFLWQNQIPCIKKITPHKRMDDSSWSSERSQYVWKNEWPVATSLCKWNEILLKELKTASGVLTKIFCLGNRWGFEKIYSPWKNGMAARAFGHLSVYFSKNFCSYFCGINRHL